ncbi:hypothetical protein HPB50_026117 [Hyalomma asiaticum]|uniref:Uncharacterized protein n=1 Tax=Hyalomma asiaticum TaxID=266040 RepID=A0ACB7TUS2_HYAAI|nr:hypothetical protein HPB50_026117 [Hyalomma asiaticum]
MMGRPPGAPVRALCSQPERRARARAPPLTPSAEPAEAREPGKQAPGTARDRVALMLCKVLRTTARLSTEGRGIMKVPEKRSSMIPVTHTVSLYVAKSH